MNDKEILSKWADDYITSNQQHISHHLTELATSKLIKTIVGMSVMLSIPLCEMLVPINYLKTREDLETVTEVLDGEAFISRGKQLSEMLKKA